MCGMLVGADMTRRLFLVIDSMVLMTNAIGTDQMKDDAKRRWWQVQMIEELNRLAVDLKHRRAGMVTMMLSHSGKKDQKCTVQRKKEGGGERKRRATYRQKYIKCKLTLPSLMWWNLKMSYNRVKSNEFQPFAALSAAHLLFRTPVGELKLQV